MAVCGLAMTVISCTGSESTITKSAPPGIFISETTTTEGQDAVFSVSLTQAAESDVTVDWATTTDGTATANLDFMPLSGSLTILKGELEAFITVPTLDDVLSETPETLIVTLVNASKAVIIKAKGTATINDNDLGASLSISDATIMEGSVAIYTVTASEVSGKDVFFDWEIQNATTSAADFPTSSGTAVKLPAGALSTTFSIATNDDTLDEEDENFSVVLLNPVNASLLDNVGTGVIQDNDSPPSLSISDAVVVESNTALVTVSLSQISGRNVSFDWITSNGTAISGVDYNAGSAIAVTIPAGQISIQLNITTLDDLVREAGEYFDVTISNPVNATITDSNGVVTIQDNDPTPALSISDVTITEGGTASFTISLNVVSGQDVTVDWATANASAVAPGDYTSASGSVTIPSSSLSTTVTVATNDDSLNEASETFSVILSNQTNAVLADAMGIGTITDNDALPSLSINDVSVTEGGTATVTVSLSAASGRNVGFDWITSSGSALSGVDFTAAGAMAVMIPAGSTTTTLNINTTEDSISEAVETLTATLSAPTNATISDNIGVVSILDNDPTPTLVIDDVTVTEGGNTIFTVTLSSLSGSAVTFDWATANNTAVAPGDFVAGSGTKTIAAGALSATITVVTSEDTKDENNETFSVILSNPAGATLADATGIGTITDNDAPPTISVSDATVTEGGTASLTVSISTASELPVSFDWVTSNNTATSPLDYTSSSGSGVTIAAGSLSTVIMIPTIDDVINESTEDFNVTLSVPVNATIADGASVVTIIDNEALPSISITDVIVAEGGTATFTISTSQTSGLPVSVDWSTVNGTATAPSDFVAGSGTATIAAGSTSTTVNVVTSDGLIYEASEQFTVALSNPIHATILDATGVGTITDNDTAPALAISDVTVTEGATAVLTVTLTGPTQLTTTVDYATTAGTAGTPLDFASASGTLTFPSGTTTQTISIVTVNDSVHESTEAFTVNLVNPTQATISDSSGSVTINDNDTDPAISISDAVVSEGGTATFTISILQASSLAITVDWASASNTAVSPADFTAASGTATIAPGATSTSVNVVTLTDALSETTETFYLNLSNPSNATILDNQGLGTISDGNSLPTLAIDDVTITEGGVATLTVTLSAISAQDVSFNWITSSNTAGILDFTPASGTGVVIPAGSTTVTLNVNSIDDSIDEASESFFATISVPLNATVADSTGVVTITDNDATPTLSISDITVTEGGTASFTVTASAASGLPITVDWSTASGTAVSPADFTAGSGSLSIPAGSTSAIFGVVTIDDTIDEAVENFSVNLANPVNATILDGVGAGTVNDNDLAPSLSIANVVLTEGATATLTVTASAVSGLPITFDWTTVNGTATAPSDYTAKSGSAVTIAAGSTTASFTVVTIDDALNENTEALSVQISNAGNASISVPNATITLNDNDSIPTLSVNDVTIAEGGTASFTVTLSAASEKNVSFDWTTNNVTATGGTDFSTSSAVGVVIPAGSTTTTLTVVSIEDILDEPNETFQVLLSNASNATFADATGVGTITDNDPVPSVSLGDVTVVEGGTATFTVSLSTPSGQAVTVDWATSNGTALAAADYTAGSGTATIAAGSSSTTFTVLTLQDTKYEATEAFTVTLSNPSNATISGATAQGSITDNDAIPSLAIGNLTIAEGGTAAFTVTLSAAAGQTVNVDWATSNGTAVSPADYTTASGTLTILEGSTTATINVVTINDTLFENDETLNVVLSNAVGASIATGTGTATITDNDSAPSLSINDVTLTEGGTATFTVTLSAASGKLVTFDWLSMNGTASAPGDFTAGSASGVTIAAGMTSTTISLVTIQDILSESSESFSIMISNPVNASISDATGVATITDDDSIPTLTVNDIAVAEGGTAVYTVTMSAAAGQPVTVAWATSNGSAIAPGDLTAGTGILTIPAGSTTGTINVVTIDDVLNEPTETYTLNLSSPIGATLVDSSGAGTITDNDSPPNITIDDVAVTEGGTATFTVSLSAASGYSVSVDWATAAGTAISNTDFTSASGTAVIAAGATSTTFTVDTLEDTLDEVAETLLVNLTNASHATILDNSGTATINDNDAAPVLSINNITITEGTAAVFTVTLSTVSGQNVYFDWATANGTALSPGDYTGGSTASILIAAGSTTATVSVPTINDTIFESAENFTVVISNPTNATIGTATGTATISDNDTAPTLAVNDITVTEGGVATFTVTLTGSTEVAASVNWATSNSTAISPADYTGHTGSVTINPGSSTATFDVITIDDSVDEMNETFNVTLSGPTGASISDATGVATLTDNDAPPNMSINDVTITEGGSASFTVSLSAVSEKNVYFDWASSNNTAVAPGDYTAGSATAVMIAAGDTTATVTIVTIDDAIDEATETFAITTSNLVNATNIDNTGVGSIADNDTSPTLAIANTSATESGLLTFTITQSAASERDVTFDYASSNGTATAGVDYTAISGTATIAAGATTTTLIVATDEDTIYEGNETFTVTLSSPVNATIMTAIAVGTITENDAAPTITINDVAVTEGGTAAFTVTVTGSTAIPIQFDWATANGTAVSPADYTAASSSVTILSGVLTSTINIVTIDDLVDEPAQNFSVVLSNATGATISDATGVATVNDNDASPSISVNSVTVTEGTSAVFTVTLSAASEFPVTFDWTTADGTAVAPSDYTSANGFGVTIPIGSTTSSLTVLTINDIKDEVAENFSVTISNPGNATIVSAVGTGTLNDDDAAPTLSINDISVTEGGTATFVVNLGAVSELPVTVDWSTSPGTATSPADYTSASGTLTIPAGNTSGTLDVTTIENIAYELNETFTVTLANPQNSTILDGTGVATINDNDTAPTLAINDISATEGGVATLTVTVTGSTEVPITFNWATSNGTAVQPGDYTAGTGTAVTILAGATTSIINVTTIDDALNEATENLSVVLSAATNASFSDNIGVITILDNDSTTTLSINDVTIVEGVSANFTVSLNTVSGRPVSFDWTTADATASAPSDYTANGGTVTIPAGSTTAMVSVVTINDLQTCEIGEHFNVVLSNPVDATISDSTGVATISDNDPQISVADSSGVEGVDAAFLVTLSAACSADISFNYATTNGTAIAPGDYTTTGGTATILAGATSTTINVPRIDDAIAEVAETFTMTLSSAVNAIFLDAVAIGTITDNDAGPDITIAAASALENAPVVFTVSLSQVAGSALTVNYATTSGTATSGTDFTATSGTLTIPAGSSSGTISVPVTNDTLDEANETFTMTLSSNNLGNITVASATGTINDNDATPTVSINSPTVTEVGPVIFTVTLSAASGLPVTVDWATANGTAISGSDFTNASGTATINAGTTTQTFSIATINDTVAEASENFTATISNPTNATLGTSVGTGTITDNDTAPTITINSPAAVSEGSVVTFTISLSAAAGTNVNVNWSAGGGSAVSGTDYTAASGTATITAGSTSTTVDVTTIDDTISEGAETFNVTLSSPTFGTVSGGAGVGSISASDGLPTLVIDDVTVAEGAGTATFTVTASNASSSVMGFTYATSSGTAISGTDFTAGGSALTIAAGALTKTFTVAITNDTLYEASETFTVTLTAPSNATIADATGIGTITDNDTAPTLAVNDVSVTEGGIATFTITQSAVSGVATTVDWTTVDGTALAGSDYTTTSGTKTIAVGATSTTMTVATIDDAVAEPTETFTVLLSNPTSATISDNTGIGTITDNDIAPSLSINDVTVAEGGTATFTVTLSAVSSQNVTFDWATSNGTAVTPADYNNSSGTAVTILAGATTATLNVVTQQDILDEANESFNVTLSGATGATISDNTGIATITDDDVAPSLSIDSVAVTEGGSLVFTVTLSAVSGQAVGFDWATSNVNAIAGTDYTAGTGTLSIAAGATTKTVTVVTTNDSVYEVNETLNVTISNPTAATLGTAVGVGTINDNDSAPTMSINDVTVAEGGTATFTVTLSAASGQNVTFDWATSSGTAVTPADYNNSSGTGVTILAGATTATLNVVTQQDLLDEVNEAFTVTLSSATGATISDNTGIATITDDDATPSLSINSVAVTEGGNLIFTVTLSAASGRAVGFDWATSNVNATAGSDYTAGSASETIAAGATTKTITVVTTDDSVYEVNETMNVTISNPTAATLGTAVGVGTINDNDSAPSISINDVTVAEGGTATFTVTLSAASAQNVTFNWATANGTALTPADYNNSSGTGVTILAGATTATLNVVTQQDLLDEVNEAFTVTLSGATGATISDNTGIATITDDDATPSLSINSVAVTEGGNLVFTVTLSAVSGQAVGFDWATSNVNATAGTDYTAGSATETIAAGATTKTITVVTTDDSVYEVNETLNVTISNPTAATLGTAVGVGTITENDIAPTLSINNVTVVEGVTAGFTITLSAVSGSNVTVTYATSDVTATAGSDYTSATNTATILAGATTTTVNITTADDNIYEGPIAETFSVTLTAPTNATIATAVGTGSLTDNEPGKLNGTLAANGDVQVLKLSADSVYAVYIADETTDGKNELYSVNTDGTGRTKISGSLIAGGNVLDFKISADSTRVVYLADQDVDSVPELYSVAISGGAVTKLNTALGAGRAVMDFAVSANSSKVVYIADEATLGQYELYSVGITGASLTTLNPAMVAGGDATSFAISPDSSRVVYRADKDVDDVFELYAVNMDGASPVKISVAQVAGGNVTSFKVSPDSSRAVYISDSVVDERFDLHSVTLAGTSDVVLNGALIANGDVTSFEILPNSAKVVYLADQSTENVNELYSTDLAGGSNVKLNGALVAGGNVQRYLLTPDSASVVYLADATIDTVNELFSVTVAGASNTKVHSAYALGRAVTDFKISPDSSKIIYLADETSDDVFELFSVNLSGAGGVKISGAMISGGDVSQFVISANSAKVAYVADQTTNNVAELYKVAIGGGANTRINATLPTNGNVSQAGFLATNDSTRLVYIVDQVTDEVFELFAAGF